jgi:pyocin large subunit-like protein
MALTTNGFESIAQLNEHFQEHGSDFGASSASDYERMADAFLGGSKAETVHECIRACGMKLRYDSADEAFGILDRANVILTYFKPVPCSSLAGALRAAAKRAGRCHGCANNLVYFNLECKK